MRKTLVILTLIFAVAASDALAQLSYQGYGVGVQLITGLGITKGRDFQNDVEDDGGDASQFDLGSGATFRVGLAPRFRIVAGFYIEPEFLISGYSQEISLEGAQIPTNVGPVVADLSYRWTNTDIALGIIPEYFFRFAKVPVHPFVGFGPRLRFFRSGDVDVEVKFKDPQLQQYNQKETIKAKKYWTHDGEDQSSPTVFGLVIKTGVEFPISRSFVIPLVLSYDLNFNRYVANIFRIESGFAIYF